MRGSRRWRVACRMNPGTDGDFGVLMRQMRIYLRGAPALSPLRRYLDYIEQSHETDGNDHDVQQENEQQDKALSGRDAREEAAFILDN